MPIIQQLPPVLANQIAAGEVVERPASAAKELLENAIDAGAKHITLELQNGGMTFLRVTDDGCGMASEDAERAFLPHATSKLRTERDLEAIKTLGFRGEALAAISSVSRIDLLTKTEQNSLGYSLHLEAGEITERGEAGCPNGTTMLVRDLFFNTPARMKFMKSDSVEGSAVVAAAARIALAHPEISLRVIRDGKEELHTAGDGELSSAVRSVMGKQFFQDMLEVDSHYEAYRLTGFVSKPTATRGTRTNQFFFVNGRHVVSKTMMAALEDAYRNCMMVGRHPFCVLHLQLPEHLVDVNVHPAKIEVKFVNERDLFSCIRYGVQGALERASGRVELHLPRAAATQPTPVGGARTGASGQATFRSMRAEDFRTMQQLLKDAPRVQPPKELLDRLDRPTASARTETAPLRPNEAEERAPLRQNEAEEPAPLTYFEKQSDAEGCPETERKNKAAAPLAHSLERKDEAAAPIVHSLERRDEERDERPDRPTEEENSIPDLPTEAAPSAAEQQEIPLPTVPWRFVGEVLDTYLIVEQGNKMLLIDKHAAHERLLFEKFRKQTEPIMPQYLLTPILCRPEREAAAVLLANEELLTAYGFALTDYGDGTLAVQQIPTDLSPDEAEDTLCTIAADLKTGRRLAPEALRDTLLHTISCKAAIKGGRRSEAIECEAIVREVLSREDLKYCPHGRPICLELTAAQIEKQFKR